MNLDELKQPWNEHARKLDHGLSLNAQAIKAAHLDKTRSALDRAKKFLLFELFIGIALLVAGGSYIANHFYVPTLAIPAFIFAASVLVAVIGDIRELSLLGQISYADPVTTIQKKLERTKLYFLRTLRLMVLMLPLYMVYVVLGLNLFFGWDILAHGNPAFLWSNFVFSAILIGPTVWIFRNLNFENAGNPVIRALVSGSGGKEMIAAMQFLKTVQDFESDPNVKS